MNVIRETRWQVERVKELKTLKREGTCLGRISNRNQPGYSRMDKKTGPMFISISLMLKKAPSRVRTDLFLGNKH